MNEHLPHAVRLLLQQSEEELQLGELVFKHSPRQAGRYGYLAAFHAATAVIVHDEGIGPKTHKGVQTKFSLMSVSRDGLNQEMASFLSRAYSAKQIADYEYDKFVSPEEARSVLTEATAFLAWVKSVLGAR